jgi:hypothetical protein
LLKTQETINDICLNSHISTHYNNLSSAKVVIAYQKMPSNY